MDSQRVLRTTLPGLKYPEVKDLVVNIIARPDSSNIYKLKICTDPILESSTYIELTVQTDALGLLGEEIELAAKRLYNV